MITKRRRWNQKKLYHGLQSVYSFMSTELESRMASFLECDCDGCKAGEDCSCDGTCAGCVDCDNLSVALQWLGIEIDKRRKHVPEEQQ